MTSIPCCPYHVCHHVAQLLLDFCFVSMQTNSVSGSSSSGGDVQQHQAVFDPPVNSVGLNGVDLQDYGSTSELISLQNEISEMQELQNVVSDDRASDTDALIATSKALSLMEDQMVDLQLSKSLPSHIQSLFGDTLNIISNAETHIEKAIELVSLYGKKTPSRRKLPSFMKQSLNNQTFVSPKKYHFNSGMSKADYHMRAKSHRQGYSGLFGYQLSHHSHQQGYHSARIPREEGSTTHRRLQASDDGTDICVATPTKQAERKKEQCLRLAECANNYGLYDMFVFSFGDDIDFETGGVDDEIEVYDERELSKKVRRSLVKYCSLCH